MGTKVDPSTEEKLLAGLDSAISEAKDTFHIPNGFMIEAYCLYKHNRGQEALAALKTLDRDAKVLQLEAQILENFSSCISTYQELLQNNKVDSDEVKSNIIAAYVSGGRSQDVQAVMDSMKVSTRNNFNLAYNAGCALIERGDLCGAEEHLLDALELHHGIRCGHCTDLSAI